MTGINLRRFPFATIPKSSVQLAGAVVVLLLITVAASAAGPRRWFRETRPLTYPNYGSYRRQYRELNYFYPKYRDGFHARYFESLGLPSGDRGPRGNGLYATPW
jgi:hypothetical protein